jgi:hypothetical protein
MSSQITPLFPVSGTDTAKVQGIPVSTVDPINGQVLVYKSATLQYEPAVATTGVNEITLGTDSVGLVAEVSTFTFLGDPATWDQLYFTIGVPTGQAYVWFNRDGNNSDPAPAGFVRGIQIEPGEASYGSAAANRTIYANTMVSAFGSDPDLSATRSGDVVTITSRASGARTNITLGNLTGSDASVAVVTEGGGTAGVLGSVVLKSGNANADVSIKNIDGNIRFDRSAGNITLGNAAALNTGTTAGNVVQYTSAGKVSVGGSGIGGFLNLYDVEDGSFVAINASSGIVYINSIPVLVDNGQTASININGTVGATTAYTGAFTSITLLKTITATGTTGARTINKASGSVNFASTATSLVVTNDLVTVNSVIQVSKGTNNSTARLGAVVAAAGSFTIYMDVAPTAETRVNFTLTN